MWAGDGDNLVVSNVAHFVCSGSPGSTEYPIDESVHFGVAATFCRAVGTLGSVRFFVSFWKPAVRRANDIL